MEGLIFGILVVFSRLQLETGPPRSFQTREGSAVCSAKGVPSSFLSYFLDYEYCSRPRNRTRDSALQSSALQTELILPR